MAKNTQQTEEQPVAKTLADYKKDHPTTSGLIRHLAGLAEFQKDGKPDRSKIAKFIDKRYQHVRNVLITPVKKAS